MKIPEIMNTPEYLNGQFNCRWDSLKNTYFLSDVRNDKLLGLMGKLNNKAIMALSTALAEWIYWRIQGGLEHSELLSHIESLWAGVIDKLYLTEMDYDQEEVDTIEGDCLFITSMALDYLRSDYMNGHYYLARKIEAIAMLARYIAPNPKIFDTWLSDCLKRAVKYFPCRFPENLSNDEYNNGYYESADEPPIPREFFFQPNFDYETADIPQLLDTYLQSLQYEENDYLASPAEMIDAGFKGTPYRYEGK